MKCIYCSLELPNKANFCPKCVKQIICLKCNELLVKDATICIYCGKSITQNSTANTAVNTIEFSENENGRAFKAAFTDSTAGNVVETFASLLPNQMKISRKELSIADISEKKIVEDVESIEMSNNREEQSDNLAILEQIFKNKDGKITIHDSRIKANSRRDFTGKLTLLFLYYQELLGNTEVDRKELTALLNTEKLNDGSFRRWLSESKSLINNEGTSLSLRPAGKEQAEKIILDFLDSNISNTWELKSSGKKTKKEDAKSTTEGKSKSSKAKLTSYQIVTSLNLKPNNKKTLADFYSEYSVRNNFDNNLLFTYYLERVLEEQNISINHIYTCYKSVNIKVPNIYQSLADTKKRRGWVETSDMNNLKVTTAGENYLEHDMVKK